MDEEEKLDLAGIKDASQDDSQSTYCDSQEISSQRVLPESPSYDIEPDLAKFDEDLEMDESVTLKADDSDSQSSDRKKRKLSEDTITQETKIKKLDNNPDKSDVCADPTIDLTTEQNNTQEIVDINDSQTLHLQLSSSWGDNLDPLEQTVTAESALIARHKSRLSDQDTTDSVSSLHLESPDAPVSVANKLITKLSNGDASTPTDGSDHNGEKRQTNISDKTPSTISPLGNGRANFPLRTPKEPIFDIHVGHDEDGEILSLYIVRTDHDLGLDMAKEFNRISKRFTIDPYLGDVSKNSSPSSVFSGGPLALPTGPRASFASTASSSGASSRTSDGAFIVPNPPGKNHALHGATGVKGYFSLLRKLREILGPSLEHEESHLDKTHDVHSTNPPSLSNGSGNTVGNGSNGTMSNGNMSNGNMSNGMSNGVASPEEISRCDRATPKSSLKKTKGRGRRPLAGKTKRAILPTQTEEPEFHNATLNSPEMVSSVDTISTTTAPLVVSSPRSARGRGRKPRGESPRPSPAPAPPQSPVTQSAYPPGTVVLAKWIDKRYYSGRVRKPAENSKYVIEFDDSHVKTLSSDLIIFGDAQELPLKGQSVYVMVDEEQNYEPGLVLEVEAGDGGTLYKCTTDREAVVCVSASELYMTEDQARSLLEARGVGTPRRRDRELHLDNIVHGSRTRTQCEPAAHASTSGTKLGTPLTSRKRRQVSESSELSEGGASLPASSLEEVAGVEPELHKTPRKIDGVKAGPLQLKGLARQNVARKHSKLSQFELDDDTIRSLGPIPPSGSRLFHGLHFLLTCSGHAPTRATEDRLKSSSETDDGTSTGAGSDHEDMAFSQRGFHKERLRVQLEAGGGAVYSHFDDVPEQCYKDTVLVAPRPCRTAKYIQCLSAGIKAVTHDWVIASCAADKLCDRDSFLLPAGWSLRRQRFVSWRDRSDCSTLRGALLALCGEPDTFVRFWSRVCTLAGLRTRVVDEDQPSLSGTVAVLTDPDCPHELQNKANQDGVPLVSTQWLWQCIIEGELVRPAAHAKFAFSYTEPD